jgi:hypothetical protein
MAANLISQLTSNAYNVVGNRTSLTLNGTTR